MRALGTLSEPPQPYLDGLTAHNLVPLVEGAIQAEIDGVALDAVENDTLAVPTHARVKIANRSAAKPAFLFQVDDAPMQRKLGFSEVFN